MAAEGRTKELGGKELEKARTQAVFTLLALFFPLLPLIIKENICERHSPSQHCRQDQSGGTPLGPLEALSDTRSGAHGQPCGESQAPAVWNASKQNKYEGHPGKQKRHSTWRKTDACLNSA